MARKQRIPSLDDLNFGSGNDDNVTNLMGLMLERRDLGANKKEIEDKLEDVNTAIISVMKVLDIPSARQPGIGTVTVSERQRTTYSEDRIRIAMAENGVEINVIPAVLNKAGRVSTYTTVIFREDREG